MDASREPHGSEHEPRHQPENFQSESVQPEPSGPPLSFSLVTPTGEHIQRAGVMNSLFERKEQYESRAGKNSPVVLAINQLREGGELNEEEHQLVRSLVTAWLRPYTDQSAEGVSSVIVNATEIPEGVFALEKIGMVDRGVEKALAAGATIAGTLIMLDAAFDSIGSFDVGMGVTPFGVAPAMTFDFSQFMMAEIQGDVGMLLVGVGDGVLNTINRQYRKPGEEIPLADFNKEGVVGFLRYAQMLPVVEGLEAEDQFKLSLLASARQRTLSAFLAVSRQIEGIALNGLEAVPSVASAHAAVALGLSEHPDPERLLKWIEAEVEQLPDEKRKEEAQRTLAVVQKNCGKDARRLARRINTSLTASHTAELSGYAAMPFSLSFGFLGLVSDGLEHLTKDTPISPGFKGLSATFKGAARVSKAAPTAVAVVLQAGGTVEDVVRGGIDGIADLAAATGGGIAGAAQATVDRTKEFRSWVGGVFSRKGKKGEQPSAPDEDRDVGEERDGDVDSREE